ncbi:MAG: DUF2341 domain-containing protein [Gammaproteobacteria bacterium]
MKFKLLFAVALMAVAAAASAWWNEAWSQRMQLLLDTTPSGVALQSAVTDAPVLVRLHAGNFPQFLNVREGGIDFRFVAADDQTPLKYHVERFDPIAQIALAWVRVPIVQPADKTQKIHLYFGNQSAVRGEDAGATYDADTGAVFHFDESAGAPQDSTAYGTVVSGEWFPNPASIIGAGAMLGGTGALTIADGPQLAMTPEKGWSASLWVRFDELPATPAYVLDRAEGGQRLSLVVEGGQAIARYADATVTSATPLTAGRWHQLAVVLDSDGLRLHVDGEQTGLAPVALAPMGGDVYIGGSSDGSGLAAMAIDELHIASAARSADFVALTAATGGERNDAVIGYLEAEAAGNEGTPAGEEGGGHAGHFGIIIQNVFGREEAIVEQLVIGVCGVMAAIAIMVMFLKALYLGRCRRTTRRFLAAFEQSAAGESRDGGLQTLYDAEDEYGDSPLFIVYKSGIDQIRARLSPAAGAATAGLDAKALNSVRASLDAVMVRQSQKLNGLLVLLTIAISGGPFIGLLGTVVGVMVTFAAIAATGDVNIAAIAPGMAAALLATVAGLGVAIPALFGYNYLSAMAKEVAADMHVFADELLAKINENYGL